MKKLTLLCTPAQQEKTLDTLRDLKVVHVEHVQAPAGSELDTARNHLQYVQRAQEVLTAQPDADPTGKDPDKLVDTVWKLLHKEKELKETLQALEHEHARITPFGEFDPREIQKLKDQGLSDADIFDVAVTSAGRAFLTKVLDALGSLPDAGFESIDADLRAELTVGKPIDTADDEVMT